MDWIDLVSLDSFCVSSPCLISFRLVFLRILKCQCIVKIIYQQNVGQLSSQRGLCSLNRVQIVMVVNQPQFSENLTEKKKRILTEIIAFSQAVMRDILKFAGTLLIIATLYVSQFLKSCFCFTRRVQALGWGMKEQVREKSQRRGRFCMDCISIILNLNSMSEGSSLQGIKVSYQQLLQKYLEEAEQIENMDSLYTKFRNLKLYEAEYDRNEELKKELLFWNNPAYHKKSQNELQLEAELHQLLEMNQQLKMQLARGGK